MIHLVISIFFSSIRRHTRCLSDWSSDVCSSDLWHTVQRGHAIANGLYVAAVNRVGHEGPKDSGLEFWGGSFVCDPFGVVLKIGRASCRESVEYVLMDVLRIYM